MLNELNIPYLRMKATPYTTENATNDYDCFDTLCVERGIKECLTLTI